jgi:hypothetical protein
MGFETASVAAAAPAAITYPAALSATQLDATASVRGAFSYTPPVGTVLSPGTQDLTAVFTPADTGDYTTAAATQSITVNVRGNFTLSHGQTVTFNGGSLSGNVTMNGGTLILNSTSVGNNLQVHGGTVITSGNTVSGQLQINNNTAPVRVFDNNIGKDLQCSGNSAITGAGNTPKQEQGQCSAFGPL